MYYEIHITVLTDDVIQFKLDCEKIGVKPIVIETQNKDKFEYQVMTSSKYKAIVNVEQEYGFKADEITNKLLNKGYKIIRQKVEKSPDKIKSPNFIYYESHLRLKIPKSDLTLLEIVAKVCNEYNFHLSKNIFKSDDEFIYQMITYRNYNQEYYDFINHVVNAKSFLDYSNIFCDKVETEEAIFDSNIHVDNNWLNNE